MDSNENCWQQRQINGCSKERNQQIVMHDPWTPKKVDWWSDSEKSNVKMSVEDFTIEI